MVYKKHNMLYFLWYIFIFSTLLIIIFYMKWKFLLINQVLSHPFLPTHLGTPSVVVWAADCHVTRMRLPIGQWPHHMTPSSHPIGCQVSAGRGSNFWLRSSAVWTEVATWQSRYIFIIFRYNLTVVELQNCEKFVIKLVSKLPPILIKWEWRILKQNAVKHLK